MEKRKKIIISWLFAIILTGCQNNSPSEPPAAIVVPTEPVEPVETQQPIKKPPSSVPRQLKISVDISAPEDLKVKVGDRLVKGQILSDRPSERQSLEAKKKQLVLAIAQARLLLQISPLSQPNFEIEEIGLAEAKAKLENLDNPDPGFQFKQQWLREVFEAEKIAEMRKLSEQRLSDMMSLEVAIARLNEAKLKYQQQVLDYQTLMTQKKYELTSLQTQLDEVERQLQTISQIKSPYSGEVKKIKFASQSNNTLTAQITIAPVLTDQEEEHSTDLSNDMTGGKQYADETDYDGGYAPANNPSDER
jgi:hypothetical protein